MDQSFKETIWRQFGASIDMLENAIALCPSKFWDTEKKFWYITYHCLFYLDYYLTLEPDKFSPPSPYTLSEFDPNRALLKAIKISCATFLKFVASIVLKGFCCCRF